MFLPILIVFAASLLTSALQATNLRGGTFDELTHGNGHGILSENVRASEIAFPLSGMLHRQPVPYNETRRGKYMNSKSDIDIAVLDGLSSQPTFDSADVAPAKVAFLFLVMEELSQPAIWNTFFAAAKSVHYSIYAHQASKPGSSKPPTPLNEFGGQTINWVNSSWCALAGVEVALIDAALQDPSNTQLVFVSHDAVPVKSFQYIYRQLVLNSPTTSKFCFAEPATHERALVEQFHNELHTQCIFRDFYRTNQSRTLKHHEWVVLSRPHAESIARNSMAGYQIWSETWRQAAPDLPTGDGCSDESVPVTSLLHDANMRGETTDDVWSDLKRMGVEQQCLTFVHWFHCMTDTPFSNPGVPFFSSVKDRTSELWRYFTDPNFDFIKDTTLNGFPTNYKTIDSRRLEALTRHGFMFARKFPSDALVITSSGGDEAVVELSAYLPTLWDLVDEDAAQSMVWTRLETMGQPESRAADDII